MNTEQAEFGMPVEAAREFATERHGNWMESAWDKLVMAKNAAAELAPTITLGSAALAENLMRLQNMQGGNFHEGAMTHMGIVALEGVAMAAAQSAWSGIRRRAQGGA